MTKYALGHQSRERIYEAILAEPRPTRLLVEAVGICISNVRSTIAELAKEGRVYTARRPWAGSHEQWAYASAAERDAVATAEKLASIERRAAYDNARNAQRLADRAAAGRSMGDRVSARSQAALIREAERRAIRAAETEIAKAKSRQVCEAKQAQRKSEVIKAQTQRAKLKALTKALGQLAPSKGTRTPAPKKSAWADIPAYIPSGIEIEQLRNCDLEKRFRPDPEQMAKSFSSMRPGQYIADASPWVQAVAA